MAETCELCGGAVEIRSSREGTNHYVAVERGRVGEAELVEAWYSAEESRKRGSRYQIRASQAERNEKQADGLLAEAQAANAAKDVVLRRFMACAEHGGESVDCACPACGLARAAPSSGAGEDCICGAPGPQPCGPECNYPYTDRPGKGPFYTDAGAANTQVT